MPNDVTLHDVAHRVGVSARTVSRVVNDQGGYSEATRAKVVAAIADTGYRPNMLARGLITRRSDTIGLIVAEMADPFFTEFADGLQRAAYGSGRTILLASTDNDPGRQHEALQSFGSHSVDGIIMFPARHTEREVTDVAARGLPIVVVDQLIVAANVCSISSDILDGARRALRHLIGTGRTRIAMAANVADARGTGRRERGYRESLEAAGLGFDDELLVRAANTIDGGRLAVEGLLAQRPDVDAIFAYNDLMAIGALRALSAAGRTVPGDVAVIGFDDIAMCDVVTPRLSSIRIDRDQLGRVAVDVLRRMIDDPGTNLDPITLGIELVVRDST